VCGSRSRRSNSLSRVARYAKLTAQPRQAEVLTERLLEVAELLEQVPGCELYLINISPADSTAVWVTEVWRSQEELEASVQLEPIKRLMALVLPLLAGPPELVELIPLGGLSRIALP
jgi:quinol monooxygenase YgiN